VNGSGSLFRVVLSCAFCLSACAAEGTGDQTFSLEGSMSNHLTGETSPYLLQHADNPVDWYPWGDEAFDLAESLDRPIFLSIGYSTCHWCHVMEEESFEDSLVASLMSDLFVCIKVDREERPDIDRVFMRYSVMTTGSGGWPLSIMMTPDGRPFFAATYIPRITASGRIGMVDLIPAVASAWSQRRSEIEAVAGQASETLGSSPFYGVGTSSGADISEACYRSLEDSWDDIYGGFGGAPRFPTPHNLLFLLRYWHRTGEEKALEMVTGTLDAMRRGGIWDQLGHGIHRYSTDRRWLVPHFEKMLYDQALLLMACTEAFQATGEERFRTMAVDISGYVHRDLLSSEGAFYAAEDADSPGGEGFFYTWTPSEVSDALSPIDAQRAMELWNITDTGDLEGRNILNLREDLPGNIDSLRAGLLIAREERVRPFRDEKILADWNGLMIAALARASWALDRPDLLLDASHAMAFLTERMTGSDGRLYHSFMGGSTGEAAFLDDYAFVIWASIEMYEATFETRYLEVALGLQDIQDRHFADTDGGGYFFSADYGDGMLTRIVDAHDGAVPSGNSVALFNLNRLWHMTGDTRYRDASLSIEERFGGLLSTAPASLTLMLCGIESATGGADVVISGSSSESVIQEMIAIARSGYGPGTLLLRKNPDDPLPPGIAGFTEHMDGTAAAFVCRDGTCELPVNSASRLGNLLGRT
jgi:uncharacterized protein YyaL (SSP411 family)